MQVHVADHPLISHKLSVLRDETTPSPVFRALTSELVTLLAYEATRHIRVEDHRITTPVTTTTGKKLAILHRSQLGQTIMLLIQYQQTQKILLRL